MSTVAYCSRCGAAAAPLDGGLCASCRAQAPPMTLVDAQATARQLPPSAPGTLETVAYVPSHEASESAARAAHRAAEGQVLGGYRILRHLGKGGMGAVYAAEHLESGRRVALKLLTHALDSPEARKRFLREGRLAASVSHAHTVYVFGTEEVDGQPAIAMELIHGGTLQDRVSREGPLPPRRAVDAALQIIAGLEAAHAAGILHRDIKPANCFLASENHVKVGDFGLSLPSGGGESLLTQPGATVLGTPMFAAPEQLRGDAVDVRSDIYSVGATLYYLLTGQMPFAGNNLMQLLTIVQVKLPTPPAQLRPEIPRGLSRVVMRCLAKRPADRYRNYDELRAALIPFDSAAPHPGHLGLRVVAYLSDITLVRLLAVTWFFVSGLNKTPPPWDSVMDSLLTGLLGLVYFSLFEGCWGATPGKWLCRLRVTAAQDSAPGLGRAALRTLLYIVAPRLPTLFCALLAGPLSVPTLPGWIDWLVWPLQAALFLPARRQNGYAGWHEQLSGTHVVAEEVHLARARLSPTAPPEQPPDSTATLGPFNIIGTLSENADAVWLLGYDPRLLRRVWICKRPPDSAETPLARRELARSGRLRWLGGKRMEQCLWDAYEAPSGQPLVALLDKPQPWSQVRFWLLDLADELSAAAVDGTLPNLALDRVWITADGHARLLDFPPPQGLPPHAAHANTTPENGTAQDALPANGVAATDSAGQPASGVSAPPAPLLPVLLLNQVAIAALEGNRRTRLGVVGAPRVPLPGPARQFWQQLRPERPLAEIQAELASLCHQLPVLTRRRRAGMALLFSLPLLVFGLVDAAIVLTAYRFESELPQPDLLYFNGMQYNAMLEQPQNAAHAERVRLYELYLVDQYRARLMEEEELEGLFTAEVRQHLREVALANPTVSSADLAKARRELADEIASAETMHEAWFLWGLIVLAGVISLLNLGVMAAANCGLVLLGRRGLIFRLLGVEAVDRYGAPATRLRLFCRTVLVWLPFLLYALVVLLYFWVWVWASVVIMALFAVLVIYNLVRPRRSLVDLLAGTWLVPA